VIVEAMDHLGRSFLLSCLDWNDDIHQELLLDGRVDIPHASVTLFPSSLGDRGSVSSTRALVVLQQPPLLFPYPLLCADEEEEEE